jgi:hypothetical protein
MAEAGDGMEARARKAVIRLRELQRRSDNNKRKKRANRVNLDLCASIYRGVHPIRPLRLLPLYDAHYNGYILTISREDHARLFAGRASHNLSSEFRSSDTPLSLGHPNDRTSITSRSTSPHVTLI